MAYPFDSDQGALTQGGQGILNTPAAGAGDIASTALLA